MKSVVAGYLHLGHADIDAKVGAVLERVGYDEAISRDVLHLVG